MAKFSFVKCDIGGEGKRWRLMVDTESYLTLADEDFTVSRYEVEANGDVIIGPFSVEQLVEAVQGLRGGETVRGPHVTRTGAVH